MTQHQLGAPSWNRKIFFGLRLHLAERCCKNLQSARGLARCKFGPAITWLVDGWRERTDHVYSACKCCNHADHVPDDLSEWIKFWTLQLVFVSCFCYVSALLHICLFWVIQIPKRMVFYLFYLWARELKLVSFLPNFDVIKTKEAEMEPVYKTCFGRGNI